ncbi:MAG: hypothetical protein NWF09_08860 [Candidatus Bathyarchaeota archaeon]|nr:hypothetical protein [Candidatus Bathyarchaeota archaeon]
MKAKLLNKKGISPLIATIILIAICVVGGLLVYSVFMSTSNTMSTKAQVSVEAIDLVKDTDGNAAFSITIKNTGNKPITALSVTLAAENEATLSGVTETTPLQPGQTVAYQATSLDGDDYIVGNGYTVVIKATCSDGSVFVKTESVMCRFA